jgi:chromosome segregation ATPase
MSAPEKYTCRKIDEVISTIKMVNTCLKDAIRHLEYGETDEAVSECEMAIQELASFVPKHSWESTPLEELRSSNSNLRNWGEEQEEEVSRKEEEISELQEKIESLEWDLKEANARITDLESKIE